MALRDLRTFVERPTLDLPIGGKTYSVPEPDADTGAWLQQLMWVGEDAADAQDEQTARDAADEVDRRVITAMLTDAEERNLYRRALGSIWDEMKTDGVSFSEARHAGLTVAIWTVYGMDAAEKHWERGDSDDEGGDGQGEAPTPDKPDSRPASGGAESTTRSQGSGSGTRAGRNKRSGRGRRGGTSSSSGSS